MLEGDVLGESYVVLCSSNHILVLVAAGHEGHLLVLSCRHPLISSSHFIPCMAICFMHLRGLVSGNRGGTDAVGIIDFQWLAI